jgi:hypothetical protein
MLWSSIAVDRRHRGCSQVPHPHLPRGKCTIVRAKSPSENHNLICLSPEVITTNVATAEVAVYARVRTQYSPAVIHHPTQQSDHFETKSRQGRSSVQALSANTSTSPRSLRAIQFQMFWKKFESLLKVNPYICDLSLLNDLRVAVL